MKRMILAAIGAALLLSATPLMAKHRRYDGCRVSHPGYYYEFQGLRPHLKYRRGHYLRYHAPRYRPYAAAPRYHYRQDYNRRYYSDYRYRQYPRNYYGPQYRRGKHRPRIGIHLEF